jgi:hypothetical protein
MIDMRRTLLAIFWIAGLVAAVGSKAQADVGYGPVWTRAVYADADDRYSVADADDRFARAHDVQGVVTSFDRFNMRLRVNGNEFPVVLHQGTVIKPTGTTLSPSMIVNIEGYWQAGTFFANRIVVLRY